VGSLLISLDNQGGLASMLSALAADGLGIEWLRGHPARLEAVTPEQVAEVALEFFAPTAFTGVVVGDADVIGPGVRALGGITGP
jgi:zinc protease